MSSSKPTCAPIWENKRAGRRRLWYHRPVGILTFLLLTWALSACVLLQDPETSQEHRGEVVANLQPGQILSQTFYSRRPDLRQITLWLKVDGRSLVPGGRLLVDLIPEGQAQSAFSAGYELAGLKDSSFLTILPRPTDRSLPAGAYRLELRSTGGTVSLLGRNEDAYAQGTAALSGRPLDADLSFRTAYDYGTPAAGEDLQRWLGQAWLALPLLAALWLPGRLLLRQARLDKRLDWGERSAASVGLSIALAPLAMLWTTALGLRWSQPVALAVYLLLGFAYLLSLRPWKRPSSKIRISWPALALAAVFLFSFGLRLAMVRDLAGPAWVDSVHHALLARLVLEQGGLPQTYAPYLEVSTTSYHAGYHSLLAFFTWLSGLDLAQAMLILGQALNACAVLVVYLLTVTFTRSKSSGIMAALIAGVMTPMPAYYTSWGRYTQLTGLLLLPVAFLFLKYLLDRPAISLPIRRLPASGWKILLFAGLAAGGLLLVHYRVAAFLAALAAAALCIHWLPAFRSRPWRREAALNLLNLASAGLLALLLTLPWWPAMIESYLLPVARAPGATQPFGDFAWSFLDTGLGRYALGLAALGLAWSFIQRRSFGWVLLLWTALMFLLANLGALGLPGANFVNNTSVAISLFLPIAILGGYLLGWVCDGWARLLPPRWQGIYWWTVALASTALAVVGGRALLPILNPGTLLLRAADLPAIAWAAENLPEDGRVLVNPFAWGYGLYAGVDGGYWLAPLAGRNTLPPAALYHNDFSSAGPQSISAAAAQAQALGTDPAGLHKFLIEQGIRYVFIGVRGGPISAKALKGSASFALIYEKDGVFLFEALQ